MVTSFASRRTPPASLKPEDRVVGTGAGFVKDGETVRIAPVPAINADAASGTTTQKGA